ncbi:MAG: type II toxin-antitoxin system VapC family toxin [Acidimicrobiales bacterium]
MLLVDTNVWLAAVDRRSPAHPRCSRLLRDRRDELGATSLVVAETAWFLLDRFGAKAQQQFVSTIVRLSLAVVDPVVDDWARILELISTYADLNLDVVDASTVAVAERLGLVEVATMDERDSLHKFGQGCLVRTQTWSIRPC